MNIKSLLTPVYRRAPPAVRNVASTIWGAHLYRRRYGSETDRLVDEALERETWDRARWESYIHQALSTQLREAAEAVPHYRESWRQRREAGDRSDVTDLASWPVLKKSTVRERPMELVRDDLKQGSLFSMSTSGTTVTPLTIWRNRSTDRAWYALAEARWRRWYGVTRHDRWALFGGQEVVPATQDKPPYWVWNGAAKQLYLSNLHLKRENAAAYLGALRNHGVAYIHGYASTVAALARYALDEGLEGPRLRVVVTEAEALTAPQREVIGKVFGCPVHTTYGMTEAVAAASECEHGVLHLWPEVGYVEVLADDADEPVPAGTTGRLICTGLLSREMPFVRYELGDRGAITWTFDACACGRTLPRLESLDGRSMDNLVTADGRRVFAMPTTILRGMPIREAQIIQERVDRIVIKVVPAAGFGYTHERTVAERLRSRLGDVEVVFSQVSDIPRGPNGKMQGMISLVEDDGRGAPAK